MKPDINIALLNAAQEIINRFSPLIDDEYERSRLGSWGALILISAMKFNEAGSALQKENLEIIDWLLASSRLDEKDVNPYRTIEDTCKSLEELDQENQALRVLLDKEVEHLEKKGDGTLLKSVFSLFRSMHQRRKVSELIGLLQQAES